MTRKTIPMFQAVAMMEALLEQRPGKGQVLEMLAEMRAEVNAEDIKAGQETVQHARANMTDAEWSLWVD